MTTLYGQMLNWYKDKEGENYENNGSASGAVPVPFNDQVRQQLRSAFRSGAPSPSVTRHVHNDVTANMDESGVKNPHQNWQHCEQCNMRFHSKKNYDLHCAGLLHKQRLLQIKTRDNKRGLSASEIDSKKSAIVKKWRIAEKEKLSSLSRKREANRRQQQSESGPGIIPDRFYCTLCDLTMRPSQKNDHVANDTHCENFVREQVALGFDAFKMKYGNVIFGKKGPDLKMLPDGLPETLLVYRSGLINMLECTACSIKCFTMDSWIRHVESEAHERKFNSLKNSSEEAYNALCSRIPTCYRSLKTQQEEEKAAQEKAAAAAAATAAADAAAAAVKSAKHVKSSSSEHLQMQDKPVIRKTASHFPDRTDTSQEDSKSERRRKSRWSDATHHMPTHNTDNKDRRCEQRVKESRFDKISHTERDRHASRDIRSDIQNRSDQGRRSVRQRRSDQDRHSDRESRFDQDRHSDRQSRFDQDRHSDRQSRFDQDRHSDRDSRFDKDRHSDRQGRFDKDRHSNRTTYSGRDSRFDKGIRSSNLETCSDMEISSDKDSCIGNDSPSDRQTSRREVCFDKVKHLDMVAPIDPRNIYEETRLDKNNRSEMYDPFEKGHISRRETRFDKLKHPDLDVSNDHFEKSKVYQSGIDTHFNSDSHSNTDTRFNQNYWQQDAVDRNSRHGKNEQMSPYFNDVDMRQVISPAVEGDQSNWMTGGNLSGGSEPMRGYDWQRVGSDELDEETAVCQLCDVHLSASGKSVHDADIRHCEKYLCMQITLGFEAFSERYGDVPFGFTEPRFGDVPPDTNAFLLLMYRSGIVTDLVCTVCNFECEEMMDWYAHLLSCMHVKVCSDLMVSIGAVNYLKQNGPVPFFSGPHPHLQQIYTKVKQAQSMYAAFSDNSPAPAHQRSQDFSENPHMAGRGSMSSDNRPGFSSYATDRSFQKSASPRIKSLLEMDDLAPQVTSGPAPSVSRRNADSEQPMMTQALQVLEQMDAGAVEMLGRLPQDEMLRKLQSYIQTGKLSYQ